MSREYAHSYGRDEYISKIPCVATLHLSLSLSLSSSSGDFFSLGEFNLMVVGKKMTLFTNPILVQIGSHAWITVYIA